MLGAITLDFLVRNPIFWIVIAIGIIVLVLFGVGLIILAPHIFIALALGIFGASILFMQIIPINIRLIAGIGLLATAIIFYIVVEKGIFELAVV